MCYCSETQVHGFCPTHLKVLIGHVLMLMLTITVCHSAQYGQISGLQVLDNHFILHKMGTFYAAIP